MAFYLRNKGTEANAFRCKGYNGIQRLLNPMTPENEGFEGILELIFTKQ